MNAQTQREPIDFELIDTLMHVTAIFEAAEQANENINIGTLSDSDYEKLLLDIARKIVADES
jgi:hypothetical protein